MGIVYNIHLLFIDENKNMTNDLVEAVSWAKNGASVDISFMNRQLGKLKFMGSVDKESDMIDDRYGQVYYVNSTKSWFINIPSISELSKLPVATVLTSYAIAG